MLGRMDRHAPLNRPARQDQGVDPGVDVDRAAAYREAVARIGLLLEGETDWVAAMATVGRLSLMDYLR